MPRIPARDDTAGHDLTGSGPADSGSPGDLAHMTARLNEATVTDAHASLLDRINALLHGQGAGYLTLRGKDAVHGFNAVTDALGKLPTQISDTLHSGEQRALFDKAAQPTLSAATAQVQQHAARQMGHYETQASQARAAAASDLAVNAYNPKPGADNRAYRQALLTQKIELEKQAAQHGLTDPKLRDHYLQFGPDGKSGLAATYSNIVTTLLQNDQAPAAQDYFHRVKEALPEPTRDKLAGYVEDALAKHHGQNAALHAQAQSPEEAKQRQILATLKDKGTLSHSAHAIARQTLEAQAAQTQRQQSDNDKQVLGRVWDLKNNTPHPSLTDLSAADWAYLKSRGLDTQAQAILDGHPAKDDPGHFNDLHRLSHDDPVKFAQTNLLASSGRLSRAHMKYLMSVQEAINKQAPKEMQDSRMVNEVVDIARSQLRAAGMRLDHQTGSKEAKAQAAFESALRDRIIVAQQAKNGASLSHDEVRSIAMGYLADQIASGAAPFGRGSEDHAGSDDNTTPEIPDQERRQIIESLRHAGVPANEFNIRQAHRHAKGAK